ncbi:hypothetical protein J4Q44_G00263740 [Coregonus suidteri]|uniref:Uncharacterized protein n=1 Tax=Coregonus suidteri TaxID=861788 RepID=A0AAN8QGK8_9TELE
MTTSGRTMRTPSSIQRSMSGSKGVPGLRRLRDPHNLHLRAVCPLSGPEQPFRAISDPGYFSQRISICQENYDRKWFVCSPEPQGEGLGWVNSGVLHTGGWRLR